MISTITIRVVVCVIGCFGLLADGHAEKEVQGTAEITLIATTSIDNSGLQDYLIPLLINATGIDIHTSPMGTGQALRMALEGAADLLIVHDPRAEEAFMAAGHGKRRERLMHNYFYLIGPEANPAGISKQDTIAVAFAKLLNNDAAVFVSRGDNSGTHQKELQLWGEAGLDPRDIGERYRSVGSGMGRTLLIASTIDAYTLTDQATWTGFRRKENLVVILDEEGGALLFNPYSVIVVGHRARHPEQERSARWVTDWLIGPDGQRAIGGFRAWGEQVFFTGEN